MSVWEGYKGGNPPPAGTPDLRVEFEPGADGEQDSWVVYADNVAVERSHKGYPDVHRWMMNTYRLTSTQALPIHAAFCRAHPVILEVPAEQELDPSAPQPNKYRKDGK